MNPCVYQKQCGCGSCGYAFYNDCDKFRKARVAYLIRGLKKFRFKTQEFHDRVVWSVDMDRAKSVAAQMAMKLNTEVTVYSLNQAMTLVMADDAIPGRVIYVEAATRFSYEPSKVKGMLESFIDKVSLNGGYVVMYLNPVTSLRLDNIERV